MNQPGYIDAYSPEEIAHRVETAGVKKANADALTLFALAIWAGAFISLGAIFFIAIVAQAGDTSGFARLIGGLGFSLGLILVVVGGAELFTGNNLIAMAWASRHVTTTQLVRNWVIVYVGNAVGAGGVVFLVWIADLESLVGGEFGALSTRIGESKSDLGNLEAFALGILCNILVCLAVWLTMGGRTVTDKVVAILFPITAFVTIGFEHSIANMFFIPYAVVIDGFNDSDLIIGGLRNIGLVSAGNIVGGSLLVAGIYWVSYLRRGGSGAGT